MNYNIIYDSKHKKYYDINSKEGTELINNLYSFVQEKENKKKEKNIIDKTFFKFHNYTLSLLPLGCMKCALFYSKCADKKDCLKSEYETILLYILNLFINDPLYSTINLYEYMYYIYKIKKSIHKHYKLLTVETNPQPNVDAQESQTFETSLETEEEEEEVNHNPLENIINIDLLITKYNKLYTHTKHIIHFILNPNHAFILYNMHHLLDIHVYHNTIYNCIKKNFIKKKVSKHTT